MLAVTILAVGKIKEKYFADVIAEYSKRLKPYAVLKVVELSAIPFSSGNRIQAKTDEGNKIINFLEKNKDKLIIALDEKGKEYDSIAFADFLQQQNKPVIFIIGGSLGLSDEVLTKVNVKISLSQLTFPHELARVVLLEQLYRAATIINKKIYHY